MGHGSCPFKLDLDPANVAQDPHPWSTLMLSLSELALLVTSCPRLILWGQVQILGGEHPQNLAEI